MDDVKRMQEVYDQFRVEIMPRLPQWDDLTTELRAALIALYFAGRRDAKAGE